MHISVCSVILADRPVHVFQVHGYRIKLPNAFFSILSKLVVLTPLTDALPYVQFWHRTTVTYGQENGHWSQQQRMIVLLPKRGQHLLPPD